MASKRGFFLSIESNFEGAGKTTLVEKIITYLRDTVANHGSTIPVIRTREPGGCPAAEKLREFLLDPNTGDISPRTEACVMFAARREHYDSVIHPTLDQGGIVVCDRFVDSSVAYQGVGRGLGMTYIWTMNELIMDGIKPDLTLFLSIDQATSIARLSARGKADRFEAEMGEFFTKIAGAFEVIIDSDPERFVRIDGRVSPTEVFDQTLPTLTLILNKVLQ